MNICYIIYFDGKRKTGHAAHARGLASALTILGHKLYLISPDWPENTSSNLTLLPAWQYKKNGFHTLSFAISSFFILAALLFKNRPDVVYARYFNFLFLLVPLIKIFQVPLVVEHNADVYAENRIYTRNYLSKKFHLFSEMLLLSLAEGSIVVTESILNSWRRQKKISKKTIVIRNGVNTNIYRPQDTHMCKKELGLDENLKYIGFVGSFGSVQGLDVLLQSFKLLCHEDDSLMLLLVGADKSELLNMRNRSKEIGLESRVVVVGQVEEEVASKYICVSELCVAPYTTGVLVDNARDERGAAMKGDPLKIYAYMACGKPIVASYFKEAGFFLEKIGAGIAVKPENSKDLAAKIKIVLSNKIFSREMGRRGLAYVEEQGGWQNAAQRTIDFITDILDKKKSA